MNLKVAFYSVAKSILSFIYKAEKPVGTVSQRSDGKYKKIAPGKWQKISEPSGTGSKQPQQTQQGEPGTTSPDGVYTPMFDDDEYPEEGMTLEEKEADDLENKLMMGEGDIDPNDVARLEELWSEQGVIEPGGKIPFLDEWYQQQEEMKRWENE